MSDVEKYGLFALVITGGAYLLIAFGDEEPDPATVASTPVVMRRAADASDGGAARRAPRDGSRPMTMAPPQTASDREGAPSVTRFRVPSLVPEDRAFSFDEEPVRYPGERSSGPPVAEDARRIVHEVVRGETLSDIAKTYYGTTTRWRELVDLNPGLDPRALQVGQRIVVLLPPGEEPPQPSPTARWRLYEVKEGDTLSEIAARELGSAQRSTELFESNRHVLSSPDQLRVGMELRIP